MANIKDRIRRDVQSMHAYAVQDSEGMVKLDAMENPHRLPAAVQAHLGQRLGALALNRYPGNRVNDLRTALASYAQMPEGFDIMLGNGSDELIALLALACDVPPSAASLGKPACILSPIPGFPQQSHREPVGPHGDTEHHRAAGPIRRPGGDGRGLPAFCGAQLDRQDS